MISRNQKGFTIIELMISMAFISFMLLFIMLAIVQVMRVYSKGLAVRQINQAGREFTEDFTKTARYGSVVSAPGATNRICVNGTTYAWNIGDPKTSGSNVNQFSGAAPNDGSDISMIRVAGDYCGAAGPLPRAQARDVLPPDLNVQRVSIDTSREGGRIAVINVVFSTGGVNAPVANTATIPTSYLCQGGADGAYCAFAEFDATVYIRNEP